MQKSTKSCTLFFSGFAWLVNATVKDYFASHAIIDTADCVPDGVNQLSCVILALNICPNSHWNESWDSFELNVF